MPRYKGLLPLIGALILILSCSNEAKDTSPVLATINDYQLTLAEFEKQLVSDLHMTPDYKLTDTGKKAFLDQLIRKEVLIQEAVRLKLHHEDKFRRSVERFWESTLIRNLMDHKGQQLASRTYVSDEETVQHYQDLYPNAQDRPPLETVQKQLREQLESEKERARLNDWINALEKRASIEVNQTLLQGQ